MNPPPIPRAPSVHAKLDGALAAVAVLETETAELALAAAENKPGAAGKLAVHREKTALAESRVREMRSALDLAVRLDRESVASVAASERAERLTAFKSHMAARDQAVEALMSAAATMAAAFGDYIEATRGAKETLPAGVAFPLVGIGPLGLGGRSDGPLDLLILAELHRLAPLRQPKTNDFVALPFARPLWPADTLDPSATPAALDEYRAAARVVVDDIEKQIDALNAADLAGAARKEAA
ncbi:hypothetical protein MTX26_15940 [Bradyrhizobium sp. ISRA443]|uniref:hypothetical protein n=1 Tax=unclassified Bradyrhizobium TaxID=2631580 RepID=UPI00247A8900|nr:MULTISPECIES: hypothetical protein [unclassified Bradyrhizobium]WGR91852.1 hypothetical protein MTX20_26510 [Bradyrhizobium sp. ISRA435]WGS02219.1 hypothetical protein MTX23_15950 [Bradyrhizobium sp. ISRA436]WGS09104.1 hypothetical protein MTX18_15940 [Bradyrhizobium sp. ISRA437]WGS15993.1 hypothetical protein MTX26_15940 [Bradyrhizobium sp. ISRA443]